MKTMHTTNPTISTAAASSGSFIKSTQIFQSSICGASGATIFILPKPASFNDDRNTYN